jgi:hypothetical protein
MGKSHLKDVCTAEERLEMNENRTQYMRVHLRQDVGVCNRFSSEVRRFKYLYNCITRKI